MKWLLDLDTGVDDALALLVMLGEDAPLAGVGTVHGNVLPRQAAWNTLQVLALAGRDDVPVAVGAARPLAQPVHVATHVHGADGLGGQARRPPALAPSGEHAVEQMLRLSKELPGQLHILATGPWTNLALALDQDSGLAERVAGVTLMGGATRLPGNITAVAEANVWHDPEAAERVLSAPWPVRLVALDVTESVRIGDAELARLRKMGALGAFAAAILAGYLDFYEAASGARSCPLHDPLAAMLALRPDAAEWTAKPVRVELTGQWTRGMTVVDWRFRGDGPGDERPAVQIALRVDAPEMRERFLSALGNLAGERADERRGRT